MAKKKEQLPKKRGPEPDHLKIEGDWEEAVKKAVHKKPPKKGDKNQKPG